MATEQRAFAAVRKFKRTEYVNVWSIRHWAKHVRYDAPDYAGMTWEELKKLGWRIRPVIILLEEQEK